MIDVVRDAFPDILRFVYVFQLAVAAGAASPRLLGLADQLPHLSKLIDNTIGGDEYARTRRLSPRNTGVPRNDRPLLFLCSSDKLAVVHVPVIKDVMTEQP
jgi:hypothetical protein